MMARIGDVHTQTSTSSAHFWPSYPRANSAVATARTSYDRALGYSHALTKARICPILRSSLHYYYIQHTPMKKLLAFVASLGILALPTVVSAAVTIENVGGSLGLGNADLKQTIVNIISYVLGLLGLIAVVMILYGGFTWMTAGGNEDKIDTAKQIISAAAVGLVIILISWAIVNFVIGATRNVTRGGI